MKTALIGKLLASHQAFWTFDPWYRRAWYAGPSALAVSVLAVVMLPGIIMPPGTHAPAGAPWAKPTASPTARPTARPTGGVPTATREAPAAGRDWDFTVCQDLHAAPDDRRDACDRAISSGKLTGKDLGTAYFGRGYARWQGGNSQWAFFDYNEALKLDPTNAWAYNDRGAILLDRKDLADALRDFDSALRIDPSNVLALANRAEVLRLQGKLAEAQAEIRKALDIDAGNERARRVQNLVDADLRRQQARH